jgi:hypothetical protein
VNEHESRVKSRHFARKLLDGEPFSDAEYQDYLDFLDWREREGQPLLGRFAGRDASTDTVYGRCGLRPPEFGP